MSELYVALGDSGDVRLFGYDKGVGHYVMVAPAGSNDPLSSHDIKLLCDKSFDRERLGEKPAGSKACGNCMKRLTGEVLGSARNARRADALMSESADTERGGPKNAPNLGEKCAITARDKVLPVPGTGDDGMTGQCPVCRTANVKLTSHRSKPVNGTPIEGTGGFISAHKIGNEPKPPTPKLSGMPAGLKEQAPPTINMGATEVPGIGARDGGGRMDGPAMVRGRSPKTLASPVGEAGAPTDPSLVDGVGARRHADTWDGGLGSQRPDPFVVAQSEPDGSPVMHGGKYGFLTGDEYSRLNRSHQRGYWKKISIFRRKNVSEKVIQKTRGEWLLRVEGDAKSGRAARRAAQNPNPINHRALRRERSLPSRSEGSGQTHPSVTRGKAPAA